MLPNYSELLQTSLIVAVLAAAVMSRIEEIAKKLNSVGLGITDDLRDAMMDYFCEDDDEDNNDDTDNDDTTGDSMPSQCLYHRQSFHRSTLTLPDKYFGMMHVVMILDLQTLWTMLGVCSRRLFGVLHAQYQQLMLQEVPKSRQYFTLLLLDRSTESSNMTGRANLPSFAAFQK